MLEYNRDQAVNAYTDFKYEARSQENCIVSDHGGGENNDFSFSPPPQSAPRTNDSQCIVVHYDFMQLRFGIQST